jgi:hypothetical protein
MQPVVQVRAELLFIDHRLQIPIRRGHEPDVGTDRAVAADTLELLVPDGWKQLRLELSSELHTPSGPLEKAFIG